MGDKKCSVGEDKLLGQGFGVRLRKVSVSRGLTVFKKNFKTISSCKIMKSKQYHVKVLPKILPKKFHFIGHTTPFCPRTQKLKLHKC